MYTIIYMNMGLSMYIYYTIWHVNATCKYIFTLGMVVAIVYCVRRHVYVGECNYEACMIVQMVYFALELICLIIVAIARSQHCTVYTYMETYRHLFDAP